jgi:lipid-binding SYLF domain-containing protein
MMKISRKIAAVLAVTIAVTAHAGDSRADKQKKIRKMAQDTLQHLYAAKPSARSAVQGAAGYAVFSDLGVKILLAGSGKGHGIAVNNATKEETFMKMLELQAGLGVGVDKFRVVFVFNTQEALDKFINSGWEFGGESSLAAKTGDKGGGLAGAVSVSDDVSMYQLTDKGLAAEITIKSSKYSKDDELN